MATDVHQRLSKEAKLIEYATYYLTSITHNAKQEANFTETPVEKSLVMILAF
jgi:hypothetical protein